MSEDPYAQGNNSSQIGHIFGYGVMLILLVISLYFNLMQESTPEVTEYDVQENIVFENLPSDEQARYVLKSRSEKEINTLTKENTSLKEKLATTQKEVTSLKTELALASQQPQKPQEVVEEAEVVMVEEAPRKSPEKPATPNENNENYVSILCYDMGLGSYLLTPECETKISKFANREEGNIDFFEVIGVVDTTEFKLFKEIQESKSEMDTLKISNKEIERLRKFTESGLSYARVHEANWFLKRKFGKETNVYPVNYTITSDIGLRGIIIRAYKK